MRKPFFLSNTLRSFFGFIIITSVLSAAMPAAAQKRRASRPPNTAQPAQQTSRKCAGGWSGVVSLKKTLKDSLESDQPGIRKAKDRIKHKTSRDYDYSARAVIDGSANPQQPVVNTNVNFTDKDLSWGEERVWDTCSSRESGHWFIIESNDDRLTEAQASGSADEFGLRVDETSGTYSFYIGFPDAKGTYKRDEKLRRSGHCQPKNNEPWDRKTNQATVIEGESFSVTGEKIDPNNPDRISGSKTWGDDGRGQVRSFVYQVTWRFTRCPEKLLITDLKFEHPKFPNWDDWQEIIEQKGTIDGNLIKIKAKVLNMSAETKYAEISFKETYEGDKWDGAKPDLPLKDSSVSVRLEAGEEREVEALWDSSGYAWFDDGRPRAVQRIKAEAWEENKLKDEMTKNLKIAPKPLILVHGIWSSGKAFIPLYQNLMTASHSYDWKAYIVGEVPSQAKMDVGGRFLSGGAAKSVYDNADELAKFISYARTDSNAWHVDLVAHSTGGLVARLYVHKHMEVLPDNYPVVKHLMMLGTPNNGVPCAETMKNKAGAFRDKLKAAEELMPGEMARFNQYVKDRKGTKFSALVGNSFPLLCAGLEWNDGFVSVDSAKHGVEDFAFTGDMHPRLVDGKHFGNFIKPHVVTGPRGTYPLPVKSEAGGSDRRNDTGSLPNSPAGSFLNVSDKAGNASDGGNAQTFSKELTLAPKQVLEIDMPVEAAANLGVTFMADPAISVSLIDDKGVVAGKNLAGLPPAQAFFRSLFTNSAVTKSVWKLKIENTSDAEQIFAGFSWSLPGGLAKDKIVAE